MDGNIGVARSLGDWRYHVGRRPQVTAFDPAAAENLALVLGCDGIFDVLSDASVATLVRDASAAGCGPAQVGEQLVKAAILAGSRDNVSAIVVGLAPANN